MPTTFAVTGEQQHSSGLAISNHSDWFNLLIDGIDRLESPGSLAPNTHGMDAPEINQWR